MTVSEHVYTAYLQGDPDILIPLHKDNPGTITLDADAYPHVQGTIRLASADQALLDALDPLQSPVPRVLIDVIAEFPSEWQGRSFDLCIRELSLDEETGEPVLRIASDEALADDILFRQTDTIEFLLNEDPAEFTLRHIVSQTLHDAGIREYTTQVAGEDADLTPRFAVTNLCLNPSFGTNSTSWVAGYNGATFGTSTSYAYRGTRSLRWESGIADPSYADYVPRVSVQPGRRYSVAAHMRATAARPVRVLLRFYDPNGAKFQETYGEGMLSTTSFNSHGHTAVCPPGATTMSIHVAIMANAAGQRAYMDAVGIWDSTFPVQYCYVNPFDGSTTDAHYTYAWTGVAHESTSIRTPIRELTPESLVRTAGQSVMEFLAPLVQSCGYRLVCDETREWSIRGADYLAPGAVAIAYGDNMVAGEQTRSRESRTWFDGAVTVWKWTGSDGIEQERVDAYPLTGTPSRWARFEKDTPFPGVGFSEYAVGRAAGRGRAVTARAVADWDAQPEQEATVTPSTGTPIVGVSSGITFDLSNDEMGIAVRV